MVSIISEWFVEAANHTCGNFPPEVDEMEVAGLTPLKSIIVSPPRVKESAVNMECKVWSAVRLVPLPSYIKYRQYSAGVKLRCSERSIIS